MKRTWTHLACLSLLLLCPPAGAGPEAVVRKVAESFDEAPWRMSQWSSAGGEASLSDDVAPDAPAGKSLLLEVRFSGAGFEHFSAGPPGGLAVPGDVQSVTVRYTKSDKRYTLLLKFRDGWGREKIGGQKLEWPIASGADGKWQTATFRVPRHWVRPVTITGVAGHNWSARSVKKAVRFRLDHLEVRTDLSQVDPRTGLLKTWKPNPSEKDPKKAQPPKTPLVTVEMATGEVSNVFSRKPPAVHVRVRSWRPGRLAGRLTCRVTDDAGKTLDRQDRSIAVESLFSLRLPLKAERFGRYALDAKLSLSGEPERTRKMIFARIPPCRELTEARKLASPYGLNVHGGQERMVIAPFRKAGVVWFRDYAFNYEWLLRAKGQDRRYAGWPWYPRLVQRYRDAGVKLLPCLVTAISPPTVKDGKVTGRIGPDRAWTREIVHIITAFPWITHWELDNEYDLKAENARAEGLADWRNYRAYHEKFAQILGLLGDGELVAVEQGRAGIWPRRAAACVRSGDFDKIGVVNSHRYCGVEAPEVNVGNLNTGLEQDPGARRPALLFDELRAAKRAAVCDGKKRESWLTEFGWDTLAGKVVSPYEQAVYLARAWMLAMAAGTEKCFWFFDYDAPKAVQYFDGCGLLAADGQPKLSLCSLAGLTSVLPNPRYVGSINAGANTAGYVFENDGKLVAGLWTIRGDDGPEVTFRAEQLHDYLGNRLPGRSIALRMAPVYAVGLDKGDVWYRQTAYSLATPYLVTATAGDAVRAVLRVRNNRDGPIRCRVRMALPKGWKADSLETSADVAEGRQKDIPLAFEVDPAETLGQREVKFTISEDRAIKEIPLKVLVRQPLVMQVGPLQGSPGRTRVKVKVGNLSAGAIRGTLRMHLPASWKALTPEMPVALKPREVRELTCELTWSTDWKPGETARVELDAGGGRRIRRSLIPSRFRLHRAKGLKIDGRLDDWPAACRLPDWMLGSTLGDASARVFLAWSKQGLYGAVEVRDAKLQVSDPRSFWAGDCLEIFLDTRDDKRHRFFEPGDHQFWFVPLVAERRAYVGQWKRKDETPATRYDIRGIPTAALRRADGYVMEFCLPAAELKQYRPKTAASIGLNLNLTIKGRRFDREVYWPSPKGWGVLNLPKTWGSMELAE